MSKVEVRVKSNRLRVLINSTLHLSINISELVGIQAYKYGDYRFGVEYHMKTTMIETWYTDFNEWQAILDGLAGNDLV